MSSQPKFSAKTLTVVQRSVLCWIQQEAERRKTHVERGACNMGLITLTRSPQQTLESLERKKMIQLFHKTVRITRLGGQYLEWIANTAEV